MLPEGPPANRRLDVRNRILVVDDDSSVVELLRTLLESEGYRVQAFSSGSAALKTALERPPDAAIVDLMMPGMSGLDFIHALRYNQRTNRLPVLICSAYYGNLRHIAEDLHEDYTSCLRKPFQLQELLDLVARLIATRKRSRTRTSRGSSQQSRRSRDDSQPTTPAQTPLHQPREETATKRIESTLSSPGTPSERAAGGSQVGRGRGRMGSGNLRKSPGELVRIDGCAELPRPAWLSRQPARPDLEQDRIRGFSVDDKREGHQAAEEKHAERAD